MRAALASRFRAQRSGTINVFVQVIRPLRRIALTTRELLHALETPSTAAVVELALEMVG